MNKEVHDYIEKYSVEIQSMFMEIRKLINESVTGELEEKLWAKLPSYYVGEKFIRLLKS